MCNALFLRQTVLELTDRCLPYKEPPKKKDRDQDKNIFFFNLKLTKLLIYLQVQLLMI